MRDHRPGRKSSKPSASRADSGGYREDRSGRNSSKPSASRADSGGYREDRPRRKSSRSSSALRGERIHKIIAADGLCSRREAEQLIEAGQVWIKGRRAVLGERVLPNDEIRVGRHRIRHRVPTRPKILLYHKGPDEICTRNDPEGRRTVFERLPKLSGGRWIAVGRLDINTTGLLLFTDNGALAERLMHPREGVEREYMVRVRGYVNEQMIRRLRSGVQLEDGPAAFSDLRPGRGSGSDSGSNQWFYVVLTEGRNREVRRLWESQGVQVSRLKRVRFGPLFLNAALRQGQFRELNAHEVQRFLAELPVPSPAFSPANKRR